MLMESLDLSCGRRSLLVLPHDTTDGADDSEDPRYDEDDDQHWKWCPTHESAAGDVAHIAGAAGTSEAPAIVRAVRVGVAVVRGCSALVDVGARGAGEGPSRSARPDSPASVASITGHVHCVGGVASDRVCGGFVRGEHLRRCAGSCRARGAGEGPSTSARPAPTANVAGIAGHVHCVGGVASDRVCEGVVGGGHLRRCAMARAICVAV